MGAGIGTGIGSAVGGGVGSIFGPAGTALGAGIGGGVGLIFDSIFGKPKEIEVPASQKLAKSVYGHELENASINQGLSQATAQRAQEMMGRETVQKTQQVTTALNAPGMSSLARERLARAFSDQLLRARTSQQDKLLEESIRQEKENVRLRTNLAAHLQNVGESEKQIEQINEQRKDQFTQQIGLIGAGLAKTAAQASTLEFKIPGKDETVDLTDDINTAFKAIAGAGYDPNKYAGVKPVSGELPSEQLPLKQFQGAVSPLYKQPAQQTTQGGPAESSLPLPGFGDIASYDDIFPEQFIEQPSGPQDTKAPETKPPVTQNGALPTLANSNAEVEAPVVVLLGDESPTTKVLGTTPDEYQNKSLVEDTRVYTKKMPTEKVSELEDVNNATLAEEKKAAAARGALTPEEQELFSLDTPLQELHDRIVSSVDTNYDYEAAISELTNLRKSFEARINNEKLTKTQAEAYATYADMVDRSIDRMRSEQANRDAANMRRGEDELFTPARPVTKIIKDEIAKTASKYKGVDINSDRFAGARKIAKAYNEYEKKARAMYYAKGPKYLYKHYPTYRDSEIIRAHESEVENSIRLNFAIPDTYYKGVDLSATVKGTKPAEYFQNLGVDIPSLLTDEYYVKGLKAQGLLNESDIQLLNAWKEGTDAKER